MQALRSLGIFIVFTLITHTIFAQQAGKISGRLLDTKKHPVSYATVTLLKPDSSAAGGDLTKDDGSFSISAPALGKYMLRVNVIGYTTRIINNIELSADAANKKLGDITVSQSAQNLNAVEITGEKAVMEMKVDKKVFNVEKNITTAGGSATDVLQNVPSVSVDADGNVSLRGKGDVTILIDGKPATLLGSDVASALQSLPASSIENVEVITNPSAKYDAQGMTGILNIITKKDGRFGINGSATVGAGTRDKYNANLSLNAHKGKWNVFLNSNYRINNTFNNVTTQRFLKGTKTLSDSTYEHVPRTFSGWFNTIGGTFDWNKYNSLTITENLNIMNHAFQDLSDYYRYNPAYHQYRYTDASGGPLSSSTALDYKHKFKKKDEELSIDATYAYTTIQRKQEYVTKIYDPNGNITNVINQHAPGGGNSSSFNAWADYTDPLFTKNGKLGVGVKTQMFWFNSKNDPKIDTAGHLDANGQQLSYADPSLQATYVYQTQIHAAYVNWSDQLSKFSYQLGLRLEDAIYDGQSKMPFDTTFHNSFLNLFPSAFLSYQLPAQQSVYLNYSRRTNRPNFFQMMPYKDLSNPSTVNVGNPDLIPEFVQSYELSYNKQTSHGDNIIVSAYYQHTRNLIERVITSIDSGEFSGRQLSQPRNIASGATYGLDLTASLKLLPVWDLTLNGNVFQNQITIGDPAIASYLPNTSGFGWFAKMNTNVKLPAGFSFQANGNYESPKVIAQGKQRQSYWLDLAVKKNFFKNKATLTVNCSDIFKTRRFINDYQLYAYDQTTTRQKETRIGNISFTYRFGKSELSAPKGMMPEKGGKKKERANDAPQEKDRENNLKQSDDDNGGGGNGGGQNGGNNNNGKGRQG